MIAEIDKLYLARQTANVLKKLTKDLRLNKLRIVIDSEFRNIYSEILKSDDFKKHCEEINIDVEELNDFVFESYEVSLKTKVFNDEHFETTIMERPSINLFDIDEEDNDNEIDEDFMNEVCHYDASTPKTPMINVEVLFNFYPQNIYQYIMGQVNLIKE